MASEAETIAFGKRLATLLRPGDFVLLEGELGAGKTFLVRAVLRALGVPQEEAITSPTFALVHEYAGSLPGSREVVFVHADLYRLGHPQEVSELGLVEAREDAILFVEWGAAFVEVLGTPTVQIQLFHDPDQGPEARRIELVGQGDRGRTLLASLLAS
ncbi:MAG: tRNA (adenosine(37)-N6)-threonylcarbamoyltransferase complex ATPase subunit type 1 TsaE [Myxococcales bacterium]|nr:tRNA (adenosine(37)-N6)-threonylcarbamoyltransferase complex ATPase subunit type 1 TsaE [Myxococcales bacterium]